MPLGQMPHMGPMPPNGNIDQMNHPQMVPQMRPPHPGGQMQPNMQRNMNNMGINEGQVCAYFVFKFRKG